MSAMKSETTASDDDIGASAPPLEMPQDAKWKTSDGQTDVNNEDVTPPMRCPSEISTLSTNQDICRICHCEGDSHDNVLVAPCYCSGSLQWVHQQCLQQWIKSSDIKCCELCKFQFIMHTRLKAFSQWEGLQMTALEKRKLICNITFQAAALTCVAWSLYVLIDRTAEEGQRGQLEWPFWTKLIVVALGFSGGVVFMYFQCKTYVNLIRRWKAYNRVIYVQNAPEKQLLPPDSSKHIQHIMTESASHPVFGCLPKSNSMTMPPSHSLLSNGDLGKDESVVTRAGYVGIESKSKSLQQVLTTATHYNINNIVCDKNEALKTVDKEMTRSHCKREVDVSSDEGETYGLLNI